MSLPGAPPWSGPSAPIWARVSGYAYPARCGKPLAFIRAFFDDSASDTGDRRLFLAGYINRADSWALFAEAWDEELRAEPAIDYLKMAEAQNLRDEFARRKGWNEEKREAKLRGLARVIRHFDPFSFEISINRDLFYRAIRQVSPFGLANPYFDLCAATVAKVADFGARAKFNTPIEFIFDKQDSVESDMTMFFAQIKPHLPRRVQRMIHGTPQFLNDIDMRPLQAADMLAWHLRREHEFSERLPMTDLLRISGRHIVSAIPDSFIQKRAAHDQHLPGIEFLRTKPQWKKFKGEFARLVDAGADPATIGRPRLYKRAWSKIRGLFR